MRVAVTVFGSTISPLFDAAQRLMVADLEEDVQVHCEEEIRDLDLSERIALLTRLRVRALVCGAISEFSHNALLERGVAVYPWVSGEIQEVLGIMARGHLERRGAEPTRLAIPTTGPRLEALVAPTFRRCSHLLFVEIPTTKVITKVADEFVGGRGCCLLARTVVEEKARVLLTGRCGPNALGILAVAGVEVIQNVEGRVKDAVSAYAKGALVDRPTGNGRRHRHRDHDADRHRQ